jgi:hypothetical protein
MVDEGARAVPYLQIQHHCGKPGSEATFSAMCVGRKQLKTMSEGAG